MQQLQESGSTVLDANGSGRVYLGPTVVRQSWHPSQATASAFAIPAGTVLNANTSFSVNTSGWSTTNATLVRDAGVKLSDPASGKLSSLAGADPRAEGNLVAVLAGATYNISGFLFAFGSPGVNCSVQINWYTPASVYISTVGNNSALPLGVWTQYTQDVIAPVGAGYGQIRFCMNGTPGAGHDIWGDDLTLTRITPVSEAECTLYLSVGPTIGTKLGTTRTGSTGDTFGFGSLTIPPGLGVLAVWDGGEPGVTATLGIFGTKGRFAT